MTQLSAGYDDLLRAVRRTRRRWRLKVALRGVIIVLVAGFAALAASIWGLNYFLYSDRAVDVFRVLVWIALVAMIVRFLVLPLSRRVVDEQVALYIEEHEPSLQEKLLSAIEFGRGSEEEISGASPQLVEKLIESAILDCQEIDYGSKIERSPLRRLSALVAGAAVAGMAVILLSPAFFQHGALVLFLPWRGADLSNPYFIEVTPGDATVARGADLEISASLVGFEADRVELALRRGEDGAWERWPMASYDDPSQRAFMLLDLQDESEYFAEAAGVRSPLFRVLVTDLPYVETMNLEYRFPAYTGLTPRLVEDGGDIAALRGTEILLEIHPTVAVEAGHIVLEAEGDDEVIALEVGGDGLLRGSLSVTRNTFYRVRLEGPTGEFLRASPEYAIEVLEDQPPIITFEDPGRDVRANRIEEVYVELSAEDDFGLRSVELLYSVNGGEERKRVLVAPGGRTRKEVLVGHTFFLEEEDLVDGDFISYYARAVDTDRVGSASESTTDIYFIEVTPFTKDYRQAQQGGGGGGAGQGDMANAMSQRQRLIISATFKLDRDRRSYERSEFEENVTTVALMQSRLREQVLDLINRMGNRLRGDDDFQSIIENLQLGAESMGPAEKELAAFRPKAALRPQQLALKFLQRAEATFRTVQISRQAGGGGGGAERMAEDLADLFELELDKLNNQYETVQRGERQEVQEKIDEALQRLKELARRQQQENERARRLASQMGASSAGGASQQRLIKQTEELARQLEKLSRERSRPDLRQTARRLQQAADAMKQAMASRSVGQAGMGKEALEQLRDARRLLEHNRQFQVGEEIAELAERAARVERMQERIGSEVRRLNPEGDRAEFREALAGILEQKDELGREVSDLEDSIDRVAREARSTQKESARELGAASESIRENQLKEKIRYSKGVVRGRSTEYAERFEEEIATDIREMSESLQRAGPAMDTSEGDKVAQTLDNTRDLVRGLESMHDRLDQQARRGGARPPGQGEQGESGEKDRSGQGNGQQGDANGQSGLQVRQEGQQGGTEGAQDRVGGNASRIGQGAIDGYQPGIFSAEDLRQMAGEFNRRLQDAEQLRQDLRDLGIEAKDFDEILRRMRNFSFRGINNEPLALESLRADIVESLKQFEFRLWREVDGEDEQRLYLAGSDEVPEGYRELVEEYFTALATGD